MGWFSGLHYLGEASLWDSLVFRPRLSHLCSSCGVLLVGKVEAMEQEQLSTLGWAEEFGGNFTPKPLEKWTDIFVVFGLHTAAGSPRPGGICASSLE